MINIKKYEFEIIHIIQDLEELERGNFYEVGRVPDVASAKHMLVILKIDL